MKEPEMPERSLRPIKAAAAKTLLDRGDAVLIDVREPDEYARERIDEARPAPLSRFEPQAFASERGKIAVFHCNSGSRTSQAAERLLGAGFREAYQLEGGLQAWKRAGLPVVVDRKAPLPVMRQVQIGAGSLVLLGTLLALLISPWLLAIPALVGAGLLVAGITGFCGMARLLVHMPWNRSRVAAAPRGVAPPASAPNTQVR
jgi:rhodanese-related sulfurtransferase